MDILLNPNVAYFFLVAGILLTFLALIVPGTGLLELSALFALFLAGYAAYSLPLNFWALGLIVLSAVTFLLALREKTLLRRRVYLFVTILVAVVGSSYLFKGEGWKPAVHPLFAIFLSLLLAGFLWISLEKSMQAFRMPLKNDPDALIGATGEAKTPIGEEGSVQVRSELWSARSEKPIPAGTRVRILRRDGFVLEVEPLEESEK
jgi:membrane-bound serine protease (ClpP class)